MKNKEQDPLACLQRGFTVEDKRPEREYWVITCKTCRKRWSLEIPKGGSVRGGNLLHLLNHEAEHLEHEREAK